MDSNRQKLIIGGIIGVVVIIAVVLLVRSGTFDRFEQAVSTTDPVNTVLDFYDPWMVAVNATSTDPYQEGLAETPILSKELREKLAAHEGDIDPVLCREDGPEQISARPVFENETEAQVVVTSTDRTQTEQSIVTLLRHNNGWYIADIECSLGEFAPDREFSFEQEGFLLKSVQPPLDPQYWHLVFEQDGQEGHVAPLFFDATSVCVSPEGQESTCAPDQFVEPSAALVKGQMTERGVQVKRVEMRGE